MELSEADPKGLVRESYRIEGITLGECRSIFIDWALSLPAGVDPMEALRFVIDHYGAQVPDHASHPMTSVLTDGLAAPQSPRRKGGRAGRLPGSYPEKG